MPDQIKKYTDPIKARLELLTQQQRYRLIGTVAAVLLLIAIVCVFAFRTPWVTIVSGENMATLAPMRRALDEAGIRNKTAHHDSSLLVDGRRRDEAFSVINLYGITPHNEHVSWDVALDTGLGTTDDERRRRDIMGREGQIESQLYTVSGVEGARVTLSLPTHRPFERDPVLPSASVILTISQEFSFSEGRRLALMVARGVERLEPERIMIIDQYARTIWNGEDNGEENPVSNAHQMREQYRNLLQLSLMQSLSQAFDHTSVVFNPAFDDTIATTETLKEVFSPEGMDGTGIVRTDIGSRQEVTGGESPIEPGLQPNRASIPQYMLPGGGIMEASARDWNREYEMNERIIETATGPGWVIPERSYASIMAIVERHVPQSLWMSDVPEGATPLTQEDWERYKMDNSVPTLMTDFPDYETFQSFAASALGIPVENLTFMIMEKIIPYDAYVPVFDWVTWLMLGIFTLLMILLIITVFRRSRVEEDDEILEPQLAVEDLLVSTQLEEAREEEIAQLEEIDYEKENEIKKHIERFVNEKPESVAALLRNWINVEEW